MPVPDDVLAEVTRKARTDEFPSLPSDEVEEIVAGRQLASEWEASTAYAFGTVVLPTSRNGRRYRVVTAGTSGASEPTWPTSDYGTVTSGTVTFEEDGPDLGLYDIRGAVHDCLTQRALKAAQSGDEGIQAVGQRLLDLAARHSPVGIA